MNTNFRSDRSRSKTQSSSKFRGPRNSSSAFNRNYDSSKVFNRSSDKDAGNFNRVENSDRKPSNFNSINSSSQGYKSSENYRGYRSTSNYRGASSEARTDRGGFNRTGNTERRTEGSSYNRGSRGFRGNGGGGSRGGFTRGGFSGGGRRHNGGGRGGRKESTLNPMLFVSKTVEKVITPVEAYTGKNFADYNLSQSLLNNLAAKGFEKTTKIQEAVINKILDKKNVFAISETGSGKTGAFLIPMVEKLLNNKNEKILIIAPTRELAMQIREEAFTLIKGTGIFSELIIGGEGIGRQIRNLQRRPQIIVGTPGRLKDVYQRKALNFADFNNIILDEVDRMLDMGFVDEMRLIYKLTAEQKQSLFFSATSDKRVEGIVKEMAKDFDFIQLSHNAPTKNVVQDIIEYESNDHKIDQLSTLLQEETVIKTLIFVETKRYADRVSKDLFQKGHKIGVIHGDKRQNQRKKILDSFRSSQIKILIATNVAARGIDIEDITHVVNLDTPTSYDDYIHRIGRVGRNGNTGTAFTFVQKKGIRS